MEKLGKYKKLWIALIICTVIMLFVFTFIQMCTITKVQVSGNKHYTKKEIKELKYIADSSNVMPGVDELMPCKICKVKYICGGGCFANRYAYNKTGRYASLFCPTRYENSLSMLLSLNNRVQHKQ